MLENQNISSSPNPSRYVWFQLCDSRTGLPFKGANAAKVSMPYTAMVVDFRKAVKADYDQSNLLQNFPSCVLSVYKDKSSFEKRNLEDGKEFPLKSSCSLNDLGQTDEVALIVVVPFINAVVRFPRFDPVQYQSKNKRLFPFFDSSIENYLRHGGPDALWARDDNIQQVNSNAWRRYLGEYQTTLCFTSKGMGKTTFIEAIGMQLVKPELKHRLISDALAYGRILSFDFAGGAAEKAIPSEGDIETFFTRLMIYFLCRMFDGTEVDGICFVQIRDFTELNSTEHPIRMTNWIKKCSSWRVDHMIDEYLRLTNLAFGVNCISPPVFLLDEVQTLLKPTTVVSQLNDQYQDVYHTFLSFLLTQLTGGKHEPICICTGTSHEEIVTLNHNSRIIPRFISLKPFTKAMPLSDFEDKETKLE